MGRSCSSRARLRKPHCFSRLVTHPDLRVLNLFALQKLDHLAFGASHECDANFYQRVLAEDGCAWRNARHPARREGAGIGSLCVHSSRRRWAKLREHLTGIQSGIR
jgi:hypothetical protein